MLNKSIMLIRYFKSVPTNLVFREGGHDQGREDSWSSANAVDDSIQRARVVGRQILRIGQIGSGGSTVEAQRNSHYGHANVGIATEIGQDYQHNAGQDVSCPRKNKQALEKIVYK